MDSMNKQVMRKKLQKEIELENHEKKKAIEK